MKFSKTPPPPIALIKASRASACFRNTHTPSFQKTTEAWCPHRAATAGPTCSMSSVSLVAHGFTEAHWHYETVGKLNGTSQIMCEHDRRWRWKRFSFYFSKCVLRSCSRPDIGKPSDLRLINDHYSLWKWQQHAEWSDSTQFCGSKTCDYNTQPLACLQYSRKKSQMCTGVCVLPWVVKPG